MQSYKLKKPLKRVGFFILKYSIIFLITTILGGCATYQGKVQESIELIQKGDFEKSNLKLQELASKEDGDQLVYLLDYGVSLQLSKKFKESNKIFLQADHLSEILDYQSVSRVAGSLALNEEVVQYKGDTFEKIFINAMLALNYLELNELDEALVEARRLNEKYLRIRSEDKEKNYQQNVFGKYLSAMIWEADGKYDDAYIAYTETEKIDPTISSLPADLIRISKKAQRLDSYKNYKKKYPEVKEDPNWYDSNYGELVVIYQQGWGPKKEFNPENYRYPILVPVPAQTQKVKLLIDGSVVDTSKPVYNVENAAIQTLRDDYAYLIGKRLGAFATKKVLADQVRQKNETLGLITDIVLQVSDRADLREWSTLPKTIQVIRTPLQAGKYKIKLEGVDSAGLPSGELMSEKEIQILPKKIKFISWRSLK